MKSIFRSGIPVMGKNYFPSNIQGLPTWYEIRVSARTATSPLRQVDIMVAMNAETYARDLRDVAAGRLPDLRLHLAAPGAAAPRRHHGARRPARAALQRELQGRAHAHPDEEHLLRRRARRAARHRPGAHPRAARRDLYAPRSRRWSIRTCRRSSSATTTRSRISAARCRCASRRWTRPRPHHDRRQHRRRLGACMPAPRWPAGTRSRRRPR
jgi:hypothetical protein